MSNKNNNKKPTKKMHRYIKKLIREVKDHLLMMMTSKLLEQKRLEITIDLQLA